MCLRGPVNAHRLPPTTSGANGCNVVFCGRRYAVLPPIQAAFLATSLTVHAASLVNAAPATAYRDLALDGSRTVSAYLSASDPDRVVRLHSVRFWARAGEKRHVTSEVVGADHLLGRRWQPHHRMLFTKGLVSVSRAPGCVPKFRIVGTIVHPAAPT